MGAVLSELKGLCNALFLAYIECLKTGYGGNYYKKSNSKIIFSLIET